MGNENAVCRESAKWGEAEGRDCASQKEDEWGAISEVFTRRNGVEQVNWALLFTLSHCARTRNTQ